VKIHIESTGYGPEVAVYYNGILMASGPDADYMLVDKHNWPSGEVLDFDKLVDVVILWNPHTAPKPGDRVQVFYTSSPIVRTMRYVIDYLED
jgi:hypothetical protein